MEHWVSKTKEEVVGTGGVGAIGRVNISGILFG